MSLPPPPRKNPLLRTATPLLPPQPRSRRAYGLTAAAAEGRFALQKCAGCGTVIYPARDACPACLGQSLRFADVSPAGELLSVTRIHSTADPYFRRLVPIRQGLVRADAGPNLICFLLGDCAPGGRVTLSLKLAPGGDPVVCARPEGAPLSEIEDDPMWRQLTANPEHARVLISDGRHPAAAAMARALLGAGAAQVYAGIAEPWKPSDEADQLAKIDGVEVIDLDPRDERSVAEAAAALAGKIEIVVQCGFHYRPGTVMDANAPLRLKDMMEGGALGLMRLAQAFGQAMMARGADEPRPALAWVNVLSLAAHMAHPMAAAHSAAQAAELSLAQSLRATMAPGGIRVINLFHGALDHGWFEAVPPPKVAPGTLGKAVVTALTEGLEDMFIGPEAEDFRDRFNANPKEVERKWWS